MQLLFGHTKLESTVRYLGIEVDRNAAETAAGEHQARPSGARTPGSRPEKIPRKREPAKTGRNRPRRGPKTARR